MQKSQWSKGWWESINLMFLKLHRHSKDIRENKDTTVNSKIIRDGEKDIFLKWGERNERISNELQGSTGTVQGS